MLLLSIPNEKIYYVQVKSLPGVVIYRFQAPLCFINCKVFQARLDIVCGIDRRAASDDKPGCIQILFYKVIH